MRWGYLPPVRAAELIDEQNITIRPAVVGHAAGQPAAGGAAVDDDDRRVIDHVVEVWPADADVMATADIAVALVNRWPDKYAGWTAGRVTSSLRKSHGLRSADRRVGGKLRKTMSHAEIVAAAGHDTEPLPMENTL